MVENSAHGGADGGGDICGLSLAGRPRSDAASIEWGWLCVTAIVTSGKC